MIDTSAVIATLASEPEAARFGDAIALDGHVVISAVNYVECALVLSSRPGVRARLEPWMEANSISVAIIDQALARGAIDAFERFGKGRHPAGLNFGDCFAYALAKSLDAPLLFKGDDFAKTDVIVG
ncbi:MAG TPA: type II toxin-antitoxin system VapC family toxin [Rhizomicrobium sp.]|nr:type II toxin-antitoxin system VapC family toxin [Rhizomicrobium sp.]